MREFALRIGEVVAGRYQLVDLLNSSSPRKALFIAHDLREDKYVSLELLADAKTLSPGIGRDRGFHDGCSFVVYDLTKIGRASGANDAPAPSASFVAVPPPLTPTSTGSVAPTLVSARLDVIAVNDLFAGRYRVEKRIGRGGMGEVYLANDEKLGRSVAVKVVVLLSNDPAASQRLFERLLREARVIAAMKHPNIVTIFDVGETGGSPYLAMEYVSGKTFREYIGDPSVPLATRLDWLAQVARALAAAHTKGIIHRDIKPENVMISDSESIAIVLDFGIAMDTAHPAEKPITGTGMVVGTPMYMAPESRHGAQVDARSDQYSWGVLALEAITAVHPVAKCVLAGDCAPLPPPSDTIQKVIARTLERDPAARFPSMDAMLEAFEEARKTVVCEQTLVSKARSWWRAAPIPRRLAGAMVGASIVVAFASGVVLTKRRFTSSVDAASFLPGHSKETASQPYLSRSKNEAAQRKYEAALRALKDGSPELAEESFEEAATLDPEFGAAWLQWAMGRRWTDAAQRDHYQRAVRLRLTLSPRDLALLEAYAPAMGAPPDYSAAALNLRIVAEQYSSDAFPFFLLGRVQITLERYADAETSLERALSIDPKFASAWGQIAITRERQRDVAGSRKAFETCVAVAPSSDWCLLQIGVSLATSGKCVEAESVFRRVLTINRNSYYANRLLGDVIHARGGPAEAVEQAIRQGASSLTPHGAEIVMLDTRARLEVLRGDFDAALTAIRAWQALVALEKEEESHDVPARMEMDILREVGDVTNVANLAAKYARMREAWLPSSANDLGLLPWQEEYLAGAISREKYRSFRDRWLNERSGSFLRNGGGNFGRWVRAYGRSVLDHDDAVEALNAFEKHEVNANATSVDFEQDENLGSFDANVGEVYAKAGRQTEALTYLRRAADSCLALEAPLEHTRAALTLAQVLESAGDRSGACLWYEVVLSRWGTSKPSVSASLARQRAQPLACTDSKTLANRMMLPRQSNFREQSKE